MSFSQQQQLRQVVQRGKYFIPATDHYKDASVIVTCDNCEEDGIPACIGYDKYDLCLECANSIVKAIAKEKKAELSQRPTMERELTRMTSSMFQSTSATRMESSMFRTKMRQRIFVEPDTRMHQQMFSPKKSADEPSPHMRTEMSRPTSTEDASFPSSSSSSTTAALQSWLSLRKQRQPASQSIASTTPVND